MKPGDFSAYLTPLGEFAKTNWRRERNPKRTLSAQRIAGEGEASEVLRSRIVASFIQGRLGQIESSRSGKRIVAIAALAEKPTGPAELQALKLAADAYGRFLGLPADVVLRAPS